MQEFVVRCKFHYSALYTFYRLEVTTSKYTWLLVGFQRRVRMLQSCENTDCVGWGLIVLVVVGGGGGGGFFLLGLFATWIPSLPSSEETQVNFRKPQLVHIAIFPLFSNSWISFIRGFLQQAHLGRKRLTWVINLKPVVAEPTNFEFHGSDNWFTRLLVCVNHFDDQMTNFSGSSLTFLKSSSHRLWAYEDG